MMEFDSYVISFNSTHHAIKSEKRLKEEQIDIKMIPTPREITASCGLSIKFDESDLERVKSIMDGLCNEEDISINGIFRVLRNSQGRSATRID